MLYSEFVENTGCKDNDNNYIIYKRLELMYMADDTISKQDIYEYGKKLVDNSKSPAQLALEEKINEEIAEYKTRLKDAKHWIKYYKECNYLWNSGVMIKSYREDVKYYQRKIKECEWILGG